MPEDDLEKAIFDLQDVKNSYVNEQKEFEKKIKTQEGFFPNQGPQQNNFLRPNTEGANF